MAGHVWYAGLVLYGHVLYALVLYWDLCILYVLHEALYPGQGALQYKLT